MKKKYLPYFEVTFIFEIIQCCVSTIPGFDVSIIQSIVYLSDFSDLVGFDLYSHQGFLGIMKA